MSAAKALAMDAPKFDAEVAALVGAAAAGGVRAPPPSIDRIGAKVELQVCARAYIVSLFDSMYICPVHGLSLQ